MKKTFQENLIAKFTGITKRHSVLTYPCLAAVAVILFFYHIFMHFVNNGKRYVSVAFVAVFFMRSEERRVGKECSEQLQFFFCSVCRAYRIHQRPGDLQCNCGGLRYYLGGRTALGTAGTDYLGGG